MGQAITIQKHANIKKNHKHNICKCRRNFDRRRPYRLKSNDCFMKVQTTDKRSEAGLSM